MKKFLIILGILAALVVAAVYYFRNAQVAVGYFNGNKKVIYIEKSLSKEELIAALMKDSIIQNPEELELTMRLKRFESAKLGRYVIAKGMSSEKLINMLRSGDQTPVLVSVDGVRTIYQLAAKLDKQLQFDSTAFMQTLLDKNLLDRYGLNEMNVGTLIFPNSYEFFWTVSCEDFLSRMEKEYTKFWTAERKTKAQKLGLSVAEVGVLASIVKGETVQFEEAGKIARLYLNRLEKNQKLQADPTVIFANQLKGVKRLRGSQYLENESPYNTYKHVGLPPGPIFFTEAKYIDAVLNAPMHRYIFMCAQPNATGFHDFTSSDTEHMKNAAAYRRWANENNIH
ncbi:MAG: endolytic transglycosylase MltG [Flavobacteriales bacterium]